MHRLHRPRHLSRIVATLAALAACTAGDSSGDASPAGDASSGSAATAESSAPPVAAAPDVGPVLTPSASFALADDERVGGVAMSPDGSRIIVKTQAKLGAPVTLSSDDATTGAPGATVTIDSAGLWTLHWMADNRLVAADRDARLRWRVWDGTTLERKSATPLAAGESVVMVGTRMWMYNQITRTSHLEPGAIPVPEINRLWVSTAGNYFLYADGMDDFALYTADDGRAVGTMPAGMNPAGFSDWSVDDAAFVRLTLNGSVEIYRF